MEAKIILTWLGFGTYIGGVLLNLKTWKSDILFVTGCIFIVLKIVRIAVRIWQSYKREEIEQEILKRKLESPEE